MHERSKRGAARARVAVALSLWLAGCSTGSIGDESTGSPLRGRAAGPGSGAGGPGFGGPGAPGAGGGGAGDDGLGGMPGDPRIAERIWRLTPEQLNDEVRLLFGDGAPRFDIAPSAAESGITNVSANGVVDLGNAAAFVDGARAIGSWVSKQGGTALRCTDYGTDACIDTFFGWFVRGAFRRLVTPEEASELRTLFDELRAGYDYDYAVSGVVRAVLLSPDFLYRTELGQGGGLLSPYEIASLLAFAVTDRSPDGELFDAAERGELVDAASREAHARRLMGFSDRTWYRLFSEWLSLETLRSQGAEVGLSAQLVDQMEEEYRAFVRDVVVAQRGSLRQLFTASFSWVQPELAAHYGVSHPGAGLQRVEFDPAQRGGLLTQGAWLVSHGKDGADNVVRRGMNLFKHAMCNNTLAPPAGLDVNAELAKLAGPNPTVLQTVEARAGASTCGACHKTADPMGLIFENYSSDGRWQTQYANGLPVQSAITIDSLGSFTAAPAFSAALVDDPAFQECFVRRFVHYLVGIDMGPASKTAWVQESLAALQQSQTSFEALLVAVVRHPAFVERVKEVSP